MVHMIPLCVCGHVLSDHFGFQPSMLRSLSRCTGGRRERCACHRYRNATLPETMDFEDYMEPPGLYEAVCRHSWNASLDRLNDPQPRERALRA